MEDAVRIVQRHAEEIQKQKQKELQKQRHQKWLEEKDIEQENLVWAIVFCSMGILTILTIVFDMYVSYRIANL